MERRQKHDWEAYERFLTEYMGVERADSGNWKPRSGRLPCLRGVVLGYLKTYEVVGESWFSCSRCVPELSFATDIEQRRRTIARIRQELGELLDRFEHEPERWPTLDELNQLVVLVEREIAEGKRLGDHLLGRTNRLLSDTPEHRPAIASRLLATCRGWFDLPPDEVVQLAERAVKLTNEDRDTTVERLLIEETSLFLQRAPALSLVQLLRFVRADWRERQGKLEEAVAELDQLKTKLGSAEPGTTMFQHLLQARWRLGELWERLGEREAAARELEWLAEHESEPARAREALERLYSLYQATADQERAAGAALRLARLLDDGRQARVWYERVGLPNWTPGRLVDEQLWISRYRRTWWSTGSEALLPTWLHPEREDRVCQLADELDQRFDSFQPPLGLDELRAIRPFLEPLSAWAETRLAERYAEALLPALDSTTLKDRQDLAQILGRLSGREPATALGLLTDLAAHRVRLGREPIYEILEALSGQPTTLWGLLERTPEDAVLRYPASWLTLLQEQTLPPLQPKQRARAFALLLRSSAKCREPTVLGPLVGTVTAHLHEPQVRTVVEQALPVLRDRLSDVPEEQFTPFLAALTEPQHGSFVTSESALATLELVLGLAARSPAETMATLAGTVRRLTQTEALLSSAPALFDTCKLLRSAPPIPDETWHGLAEHVQSDLERQGGAALYLLALLAARAGRDHDAASYLVRTLREVQRVSPKKARDYAELVVRTF